MRQKLLRLETPVDISFKDNQWTSGNPMYDWYSRRINEGKVSVETMQLRKELSAPFFHEFVVFSLRGGGFYRIDRRQLPNEELPIDAIYTHGVEACDTIEEVPDLNSVLYARSKCLIELSFKPDTNVHIGLILRICRAIQKHKGANVYTLQRYNCYFFAQTLVMCIACGASDWAGLGDTKEESANQNGPWRSPNTEFLSSGTMSGLDNIGRLAAFKWNCSESFSHDWSQLSRLSNGLVQSSPLLRHADHCNYCLESQSDHRQRSLSSEINRLKHELIEYWNNTYRKLLVEVYINNHKKFVASGIWKIVEMNTSEEDSRAVVKRNIDNIKTEWENYSRRQFKLLSKTVLDLLDPMEVCDAWYPDPDEWESTWTYKDGGPVRMAMEEWMRETESFFASEFSKLERDLDLQAGNFATN
ncbi:unnamed protein product [Rhizoctonia solani]|uniref:Uncharacterized protein n=1 Tax=Rhizoctonia solani TaxID=456999 RepID=A0A8H3GPC9_9AGAM|nr:unnamed protein product [Rhizoctonia solani]